MHVAAVILAAGTSSRMGSVNKLLADLHGRSLLTHVVDTIVRSRVSHTVVVTGHEQQRVAAALAGQPVIIAHNPRFADGLSTSLIAGVERLATMSGDTVDGAMICLGDMPRVTPADCDALIDGFIAADGADICVPVFAGRRGNPRIIPKHFFPLVRQLSGDRGARAILQRHPERVRLVPAPDDGVLLDIDGPGALADVRAQAR